MNQTELEEVKSIMTASPISIQANQSIPQAILLMTDHRISALPVVNDAKRPIGVLSQKDIMIFLNYQTRFNLQVTDTTNVIL